MYLTHGDPSIQRCQIHGDAADAARHEAVRAEQEHVSHLYARLDAERAKAAAALREGPGTGGGSAFQARVESAVATDEAARRLARLGGVEDGLCFGRIDHRSDGDGPGDTFYIGRIGLRDEDHEPLLIDWRATAARPFYTASPGLPGPSRAAATCTCGGARSSGWTTRCSTWTAWRNRTGGRSSGRPRCWRRCAGAGRAG